ncbi:hypothetical protein [Nocardioides sp.]|uniref:hypothetical protein n=1 Tax=Nocardioides sp. TaxID=35761 RepID=UPI003568ADD3
MSTRGSLPAGVYWRRRFVLLGAMVLIVVPVGKVLSGSSDGADASEQAVQAAADPSGAASPSATATKKNKGKNQGKKATPTPTPLAQPTGPCPATDVLITPTVPDPVAGRDVTVLLNLQMGVTQACTWRVSSKTVTLKITAGADDIWSSRECPKVIPSQEVVVRQAVPVAVPVVWNSKRSDEYCTIRTAWALPGRYQVAAAALEGEPTSVTFDLTRPAAAVVTQTADPTPAGQDKTKGKKKNKQRD